jgi:hypothetical protein
MIFTLPQSVRRSLLAASTSFRSAATTDQPCGGSAMRVRGVAAALASRVSGRGSRGSAQPKLPCRWPSRRAKLHRRAAASASCFACALHGRLSRVLLTVPALRLLSIVDDQRAAVLPLISSVRAWSIPVRQYQAQQAPPRASAARHRPVRVAPSIAFDVRSNHPWLTLFGSTPLLSVASCNRTTNWSRHSFLSETVPPPLTALFISAAAAHCRSFNTLNSASRKTAPAGNSATSSGRTHW